MVEWKNRHKKAHSAARAENQIPIKPLGKEDLAVFKKAYRLLSGCDSAIFRRIEFH